MLFSYNTPISNRFTYILKITLLFTDVLIVNCAWAVSYLILCKRHLTSPEYFVQFNYLFFNISWLMAAFFLRLYHQDTLKKLENIFRQTAKTILVGLSFFAMFLLLKNQEFFFKKMVIICFVFMSIAFALSRFLVTYVVEFIIKKANLNLKTAIIGYNETALKLAEYFEWNNNMYSFKGFFDNGYDGGTAAVEKDGKIVGPIEKCIDFAVRNNIQEVYSTLMPEEEEDVVRLVENADKYCVRVKFVGNYRKQEAPSQYVEYLATLPVTSLRAEPLQGLSNRVKKKLFDFVVSLLVIIFLLSWLTPLIALLIKLTSRGPVFFKQQRSGKNNTVFWCYKFRSMMVNPQSDALQATRNDVRVTRIGAFLRKTSMDELPQFFNVLMGNMSIVGPRPHMLSHTQQYSALISKYMIRQFLKPGITGWAQVNGYRGETKRTYLMRKRVELDIWYMENWSLMLDVKIVFMTVINVFKREQQAY